MKPQESKLWPLFLKWCVKNQIKTNKHEDEWRSFWETWYAGVNTGINIMRKRHGID